MKAVRMHRVSGGGSSITDRAEARARVLAVVARIPPGRVASYGQVAFAAGLPGRARWVGKVLGECLDRECGWHRVLRHDGRLGLPASSPAHAEQRARLVAEGHVFHHDRIDLKNARWRERDDRPLLDP